MERLIFESARGEVVIFDGPPFYLQKVNGLGDVSATTQLQRSPFQDGSTWIDSLLEERQIAIEFLIHEDGGYSDISACRIQLAKVMNPKLGLGTLRYENGHVTREIKAVAESVPVYPDGPRTATMQKGMIQLICPSPYWRSLTMTEEPTFEGLFQFPFEGSFEMGIQRDQRIMDNDGDSEAPLFIEFTGPAVNPQIINNTTGEYFKVNQTLAEGEVMEIDTEAATVFFVEPDGMRRNVFNWIDDDAVFFKLALGENRIEYTADSDIQGAIVNIRYSKLYTAV